MNIFNIFHKVPLNFSEIIFSSNFSETVHRTKKYEEYFYSPKWSLQHEIILNLVFTIGLFEFILNLWNVVIITKKLVGTIYSRERFIELLKNYIQLHNDNRLRRMLKIMLLLQ